MKGQANVLDELRRAAERRRELARAYERRAEKLAGEARQMSYVASRIARQQSAAEDEP